MCWPHAALRDLKTKDSRLRRRARDRVSDETARLTHCIANKYQPPYCRPNNRLKGSSFSTALSLRGYVGEQYGIEGVIDGNPHGSVPSDLGLLNGGIESWFGRWKPDDYQSTALHTCLDANRVIMHNQYGEKPWPGLWFRISIPRISCPAELSANAEPCGEDALHAILLHLARSALETNDADLNLVPCLPAIREVVLAKARKTLRYGFPDFLEILQKNKTGSTLSVTDIQRFLMNLDGGSSDALAGIS
ncbi:hypothetical protein BDZ97DRAFT_1761312 [Flammula alnicola]|nr:hypothetical protein BDZ97DRAFT_1761312 [Flammula alnicola]